MKAASETIDGEIPVQTITGIVLELDYVFNENRAEIRITVKDTDGKSYDIYDNDFEPYFYFLPKNQIAKDELMKMSVFDGTKNISPMSIEEDKKTLFGKLLNLFKIYTQSPSDVPKLSSHMERFGSCYENDIPFARRYGLDKNIIPFENYTFAVSQRQDGTFVLKSMEKSEESTIPKFNVMCFDIETYNSHSEGMPIPERDPVVMLSYYYDCNGKYGNGVITSKKIDLPFVESVGSEAEIFSRFVSLVNELDIDIISGYNSANFDIRYMIERAAAIKTEFNLSRNRGITKIEKHGLFDKVKIGGRSHIDMYLVVKFISVVGAAEHLMRLNSYTLQNVYEAISEDKKVMVEKKFIYRLWDGTQDDLQTLAKYNLNDSYSLNKVYDKFMPIMVALSNVTGNIISDICVSTTGQIVEYMLMRYAHMFNELIPSKPKEYEIGMRIANPIEGAYVKTPKAGIYENLVIFDFRSLYPSLMISYNIDPSSVCTTCTDYYESPNGVKFDKTRKSIVPTILKILVEQRKEIKKEYKKNPNDLFLGAMSHALKIPSNSFFGYLGYPRSRWYSRECAASITAFARQHIKEVISEAENAGFEVVYGDTDSAVIKLGSKSKDDALNFMKNFNSKLPEAMELELEDFYVRGVFVGKKQGSKSSGAKKKYALITESGRIKIRGFELVRRDWSKIARDTQKRVLETILKEGSPEKAVDIVRNIIADLRGGHVPLSELVISTQLRRAIDSYDSKSPELSAAVKAIDSHAKRKEEIEHSVISYVITKEGDSISDKAVLAEFAKDYDPEYYINNQVIPATMRILKELDFKEEELKNLGTQKKL